MALALSRLFGAIVLAVFVLVDNQHGGQAPKTNVGIEHTGHSLAHARAGGRS